MHITVMSSENHILSWWWGRGSWLGRAGIQTWVFHSDCAIEMEVKLWAFIKYRSAGQVVFLSCNIITNKSYENNIYVRNAVLINMCINFSFVILRKIWKTSFHPEFKLPPITYLEMQEIVHATQEGWYGTPPHSTSINPSFIAFQCQYLPFTIKI